MSFLGCRASASAGVLALLHWVLTAAGLVSVFLSIVYLQQWVWPHVHADADRVTNIALLAVLAATTGLLIVWRLLVFRPSDFAQLIDSRSGTVQWSGRAGHGTVDGIDFVVRFDRSFADYWPFPIGYVDRYVCGEKVAVRISGLLPGYMHSMGEIAVRVPRGEIPASQRLCSGNQKRDGQFGLQRIKGQADRLFGDRPGDWEVETDDAALVLKVRSGSWLGVGYVGRFNQAVRFLSELSTSLDLGQAKRDLDAPDKYFGE